ncbi:amidohydrolase [Sesbania bispinosa]|nr:amidohydrolase [Sesbania bispinosa]
MELRQRELEMLELMRRYEGSLKERYLNGGNIVDILGGSSTSNFWDPPDPPSSVIAHPLAPDIPISSPIDQNDINQVQDCPMEEVPLVVNTVVVDQAIPSPYNGLTGNTNMSETCSPLKKISPN